MTLLNPSGLQFVVSSGTHKVGEGHVPSLTEPSPALSSSFKAKFRKKKKNKPTFCLALIIPILGKYPKGRLDWAWSILGMVENVPDDELDEV